MGPTVIWSMQKFLMRIALVFHPVVGATLMLSTVNGDK